MFLIHLKLKLLYQEHKYLFYDNLIYQDFYHPFSLFRIIHSIQVDYKLEFLY
jgi:hypothetical protein